MLDSAFQQNGRPAEENASKQEDQRMIRFHFKRAVL